MTEWEKHRSITGWEISRQRVRFSAACVHPVYQKTILKFMDWIDEELAGCHECVKGFPAEFQKYRLELPLKTDRSRIAAKDDAYIYYDLEFSISRDEIVSLLMMDGLYGSKSLCIRELLQNALDALRYRKKLFEKDNICWEEGKVEFRHYVDEYGREHVSCTDNGVGMDEHIVTSFLTRVGRSFYKSPEFYKEQAEMKQKGIMFNPCSQFGIGFMSCFMLGNSIVITTRKDYGHGKKLGRPLEVEISGLKCTRMETESGEEISSVKTMEDFYKYENILSEIMSAVWNVSKLGVNEKGIPTLYRKPPQELSDISRHFGIRYAFFYVRFTEYTDAAQKYLAVYTGSFLNLNRDHPLIKYYRERRYDGKQTDLQEFAYSLASLAAQRDLYSQIFGNEKTGYLKRLGCLYENVSWENYAEELGPDYVIYDPVKGEIKITDEMLREWASWPQGLEP